MRKWIISCYISTESSGWPAHCTDERKYTLTTYTLTTSEMSYSQPAKLIIAETINLHTYILHPIDWTYVCMDVFIAAKNIHLKQIISITQNFTKFISIIIPLWNHNNVKILITDWYLLESFISQNIVIITSVSWKKLHWKDL